MQYAANERKTSCRFLKYRFWLFGKRENFNNGSLNPVSVTNFIISDVSNYPANVSMYCSRERIYQRSIMCVSKEWLLIFFFGLHCGVLVLNWILIFNFFFVCLLYMKGVWSCDSIMMLTPTLNVFRYLILHTSIIYKQWIYKNKPSNYFLLKLMF